MAISLLNGLSQMGAGIGQFAGAAGLEQQKADVQQQAMTLANQLATGRESGLLEQKHAGRMEELGLIVGGRKDVADIRAGASMYGADARSDAITQAALTRATAATTVADMRTSAYQSIKEAQNQLYADRTASNDANHQATLDATNRNLDLRTQALNFAQTQAGVKLALTSDLGTLTEATKLFQRQIDPVTNKPMAGVTWEGEVAKVQAARTQTPTLTPTVTSTPQTGITPQTGTPTPQAGAAVTGTPTGSATTPALDPLAMARDAINAGAPRDAVIQRLKDNNIDPGNL